MSIQCNYTQLSVLQVSELNFGRAAVGQSPVGLTRSVRIPNGTNGSFTTGLSITNDEVRDLRMNKYFLRFPNSNFPNGEIRGQIHVTNGTYNDYDGDGKTNPTVNRNLNGEKLWFILQSTTNEPRYDYFGLASDF